MEKVTCKQLRQMIADLLTPFIDHIRSTKDNQFFYEFKMQPTDEEIDEFVISSRSFDDEMKKFLLGEVGNKKICDEFLSKFIFPNTLHMKKDKAKDIVLPHTQAKLDLYKSYLEKYLPILTLAKGINKIIYMIFFVESVYIKMET